MNQEEREAEHQWALKMVVLEEERGSIVPGGAVGGAVGRARRLAEGKTPPSAAMRARRRVRFLARAVAAPAEHA
jgi:hypothetical protein